ncbi:MAG: SHOCT domain-containing protein [Enterocloster asparagiformis]|nr:SHOCT domain-containing protein [Enterocloster asparagiformis]
MVDQIKELEKYKSLFDSGAISEQEFRRLKQKLLGLKTDEEKEMEKQRERAEALAEIEKMRAEAAAKKEPAGQDEPGQTQAEESENPEIRAKEERDNYKKTFDEEKAREQARLAALYEVEQKKRQAQIAKVQRSAKFVTGVVGNIVFWSITVFCALFGMFFVFPSVELNPVLRIVSAVIFLLFAALACPPLTKKLKENENLAPYFKFKKYIVIALVIVWFATMVIVPV